MWLFTASFLVVSLAHAAVIERPSPPPSVSIKNGVVVGSSLLGIDSFKGIPYAQPPVGPLRLKAPVPASEFGTVIAVGLPQACPSLGRAKAIPAEILDTLATITPSAQNLSSLESGSSGEDCLTLNVQRPAGTNETSNLPVLVWIYGGSFTSGSTQIYDASFILGKAVSLDEPFIYVAMNYRLAAFGFLAGQELSDDGSTNLGLRDQRLALEWVQDNIQAFGGDPSKVTIWGESAGSMSVLDQTVINSGDHTYNGRPLFRAAIMNSGTALPVVPVSHSKPQLIFDGVVEAAGCADAFDKLECLRAVDFNTFLDAQNQFSVVPYSPLNIQFPPRPDPASQFFPVSPEEAIANGNFARVPMIIGNQEDEGNLFTLGYGNVTTDEDIVELLTNILPDATAETAQDFISTYPTDVSAGSPYRTGSLNEVYPGYKRLSSIVGDFVFILARRITLESVVLSVKAWSYIASYDHVLPVVGTTHALDVFAIYYGIAASLTAADECRTRYISFVNHLDPNVVGLRSDPNYRTWPQYDLEAREILNFEEEGTGVETDYFRWDSYEVLRSNYSSLRV